jgi:4-hydroxybenzoate polyprenyltransferase
MFIFGRELLLDLRDLIGDSASGLKTIPIYIGCRFSVIAGWLLMFGAVGLLVLFSDRFLASMFGILSFCTLVSSYVIYSKDPRLGLKVTRIAMVCALIPAVLSA